MKTPEETAAEVYGNGGSIPPEWADRIRQLILEGIHAFMYQDNVEINQWEAEHDGVHVVQIDTVHREGRLRINLNDAPIWDGDPDTDERPGAHFQDLLNKEWP